jgi:AcrR family transcriptional regulator
MTTTEHSGSGDLSRSMALLWGVKDRDKNGSGPGPKPGLTLERIVDTAIAIADAEGLAAVSMRRVATDLGVGTMSLYRYVPGKAELLDLMLDRVGGLQSAQPEEPVATTWRSALEQLARGMWRHYLSHPWLLHVDQARPVLGPNGLSGLDRALAGMEGVELSGRQKIHVITMIDAMVSGIARTHVNALQAEARTGVTDAEFWEAQQPAMERAMSSGCYPRVFALGEDAFSGTGEEMFEFALVRLLDGLDGCVSGG